MLTTAIRSFIRGRGPILAYLLLSLAALLFTPTAAVLVNVTVDDTLGSSDRSVVPTYSPSNSWHLGSPTEQCSTCTLKPSEFDTGQIYDQSWHHGTYFIGTPIQVSVTFRGMALYVYNVIPNTLKGANTYVDLSFSIDGATVGSFARSPDSSSTILYNHLVYSNTQLSDSVHTFVMSASGKRSSLIFFDYLVYTTHVDDPAPAPVAPPNVAPSQGSAPSSPSANSPAPPSVASTSSPTSSTGSSSSPDGNTTSSPSSPSSPSPSAASDHSNAASEATGPGSSFTTTLTVSSSSAAAAAAAAAAAIAAPTTHSNTAAIAGGVGGGILFLLLLVVLSLFFCRQRRRRAASVVDPYNFAPPDSAVSPLTYSNPATAIATSPTAALGSPTTTSFSAQREWELKGRLEALHQQQHDDEPLMAQHESDLPTHHPRPRRETRTFSDTNSSTASASRMSVGAVQALQEEIAALRGVLTGLAVYGRGHQGHHPARRESESEILPEYEEARRQAPFVST